MWHSGLRGAIAFALVETLPEEVVQREVYVSSTLAIVVATTLFVGASAMPALRWLGIRTGDVTTAADDHDARRARLSANPRAWSSRFHRLDKKYLLPLLTNKLDEADPDRRALYEREAAGLDDDVSPLLLPSADATTPDSTSKQAIDAPFKRAAGASNHEDDDNDDDFIDAQEVDGPRSFGAVN
jgi:NhaP-type Na+/H+ or K+/H+ antiporter